MKDRNLTNYRNRQGLISFKSSAKKILKPVLKNPKYIIMYEIIRNWEDLIGKKYKDYCKLEKINLSRDEKQANILVKSYNSSASFFLNNNFQYIIEKINSIFGYQVVAKFMIKEIPTLVKTKPKMNTKTNNNIKVSNIFVTNTDLKKSLSELGEYL